jgi:hypothetical protein
MKPFSKMAASKFDLVAFLAWNKVPAPVLLRGVPDAVPRYWCTVDVAKTGLEPIDGEGSALLRNCTHFYSVCGKSDAEHMVYGYQLSAKEIEEDDAWHAAHPPFQLHKH